MRAFEKALTRAERGKKAGDCEEKLVKQWGSLMDGQRQVERQVTQLSRSIASLPTWQEEPKWI